MANSTEEWENIIVTVSNNGNITLETDDTSYALSFEDAIELKNNLNWAIDSAKAAADYEA